MACVRESLKRCYGQKEAIARAIDECIGKGILDDVLVKHRAEVEDMFFWRSDRKLEEEAIRLDAIQEGREEVLLSQIQKKLEQGKSVEVIASEIEEDVERVVDIIKKYNCPRN